MAPSPVNFHPQNQSFSGNRILFEWVWIFVFVRWSIRSTCAYISSPLLSTDNDLVSSSKESRNPPPQSLSDPDLPQISALTNTYLLNGRCNDLGDGLSGRKIVRNFDWKTLLRVDLIILLFFHIYIYKW